MNNIFLTETTIYIRLLVCLVIIFFYYYKLLNWVRNSWVLYISRKIWSYYKGKSKWRLYDIENIVTLFVSILLQSILFFSLGTILNYNFSILYTGSFSLLSILSGAMLGFSEMALASGVVLVAMRLLILLKPAAPTSNHYWFILLNSGWMRLFSKAEALLPKLQATIVIAAYVGIEEIIYRSVLISTLLPLGSIIALLISTIIFVTYQVFNVPNFRAAIYPMIGALVIGLVNGIIFIHTGLIWPLIIAHIVFFISVSNSIE